MRWWRHAKTSTNDDTTMRHDMLLVDDEEKATVVTCRKDCFTCRPSKWKPSTSMCQRGSLLTLTRLSLQFVRNWSQNRQFPKLGILRNSIFFVEMVQNSRRNKNQQKSWSTLSLDSCFHTPSQTKWVASADSTWTASQFMLLPCTPIVAFRLHKRPKKSASIFRRCSKMDH